MPKVDPRAPGRAGRLPEVDPRAPGRAGRLPEADPRAPGRAGRLPEADPRAPGRAGRLRLVILDYGMGNLRSAEKAFEHVGVGAEVTSDHERVRAADGVVLPGVGAFPKAMEAVSTLGLDQLLRERRDAGVPILGICLGMQLLFERSTELGGAEGIGLLEGTVEALDAPGLKVPHIGWNPVVWRAEAPLAEGLGTERAFYHVHSFAPRPVRPEDVAGTATYGSEFTSVVARPPVYGTQFHPEKSGPDGLRLLANFASLCGPSTHNPQSGGDHSRVLDGASSPRV